MKSIILATFIVGFSLWSGRSWAAAGDVIYTCHSNDGSDRGWGFTLNVRGPRHGDLVILNDTAGSSFDSQQYTLIENGDSLSPDYLLFRDLNGNRLMELKDGNLIDSSGKVHAASCALEA